MAKEKQPGISTLENDPILSEVVKRLVAEFHPDKIILFGSRATGNATEDSDYDFFIVVPQLTAARHEMSVRAHDVLGDLEISKDIFFTSREKFELRKTIVNTLAEIAYVDGKELYAA